MELQEGHFRHRTLDHRRLRLQLNDSLDQARSPAGLAELSHTLPPLVAFSLKLMLPVWGQAFSWPPSPVFLVSQRTLLLGVSVPEPEISDTRKVQVLLVLVPALGLVGVLWSVSPARTSEAPQQSGRVVVSPAVEESAPVDLYVGMG